MLNHIFLMANTKKEISYSLEMIFSRLLLVITRSPQKTWRRYAA